MYGERRTCYIRTQAVRDLDGESDGKVDWVACGGSSMASAPSGVQISTPRTKLCVIWLCFARIDQSQPPDLEFLILKVMK